MRCRDCEEDLPQSIALRCAECRGNFHYSCVSIREAHFKSMTAENRSTWRCVECKSVTKPEKKPDAEFQKASLEELRKMFEEIRSKLHVVEDLRDLPNSFKSLEASVQFMSDKFDGFQSTVSELNQKVKSCEDKNAALEKQVIELQNRLNSYEQRARKMNVEINGIPSARGENCSAIVANLAIKLGAAVKIEQAFRAGIQRESDMRPRSIIATLGSDSEREELVALARKNKHVTTMFLRDNFNDQTGKIYINDHLTRENKHLFFLARKTARDKSYKYVWTTHCTIYMRKDDQTGAVIIRSADDLLKLP
uniref:Tropomyosin n=1 Tax=Lygus hesperus TaxID=30085 RepID=A0A0A9WQ01_LYGHE